MLLIVTVTSVEIWEALIWSLKNGKKVEHCIIGLTSFPADYALIIAYVQSAFITRSSNKNTRNAFTFRSVGLLCFLWNKHQNALDRHNIADFYLNNYAKASPSPITIQILKHSFFSLSLLRKQKCQLLTENMNFSLTSYNSPESRGAWKVMN